MPWHKYDGSISFQSSQIMSPGEAVEESSWRRSLSIHLIRSLVAIGAEQMGGNYYPGMLTMVPTTLLHRFILFSFILF